MSGIFKKEDIEAGYLLRVRNVDTGELFNMTVVLAESYLPNPLLVALGAAPPAQAEGHLACCNPDKHWWPLAEFNDQLEAEGKERFQVVAVYGRTAPKFLLDNSTNERERLWERAADEDPSVDEPEIRKMTLAEICAKLGYNVEIVEG
jgi:hypothetical protein